MKTVAGIALTVGVAGLFAGCGGAQPPIGATGATPQSRAAALTHYRVVYRFKGGDQDGGYPVGGLINLNGTLYGTTQFGGPGGTGTVFALDLSTGKESVTASSLGNPYVGGPLLNLNKTLYGAGRYGGPHSEGAIFEVNLVTGKTKSICGFNNNEGRYPNMGLTDFKGKLYGTTSEGGKWGNGAVFACDLSTGKEHAVISLKARVTGTAPLAGLTVVNGELYGTTYSGGPNYYGTIFKIDTDNRLRTLYNFDWSSGAWPIAPLVDVNGTLYGTTFAGGAHGSGSHVTGTVFKVSKSRVETVLYSFKDSPDGAGPSARVTYVNGSLYGTTEYGGSNSQACRECGTIFQLTASATESVLHRFKGGQDGAAPLSSLINVKGTLYGTTTSGGSAACTSGGCGTIFEVTP
jgi:uncharacterized repeat protein (TIGR03803 family)